jgi:hypothetical protein
VEWLGVEIHGDDDGDGDGESSGGAARAAAGDEEGDQRCGEKRRCGDATIR